MGQPIPTNDLWIAASVMEHGTELVTLDRDFTHVAQILVALYEP
jgi:predicted nucleic acid-binding protein